MMSRVFLGNLLFAISLFVIGLTEIYITIIFKDFIIGGLGVGVYAQFLYLIALIFCAIVWLLSYRITKSRMQASIFWFSALFILPILMVQPTWWAAPLLSN
jgi:hypothetical protein